MAGAVLLGGGGTLLGACGDDEEDAGTDTGGSTGEEGGGDLGELAIQFSWIKNIEFAGNYVADSEGFYLAEGFSSVNLIGGGPAVDPVSPIIAGNALYGFAGSEQVAAAVLNEDAPLKIIGSNFQENPFCILYLADNPLPDAESLRGTTIGVQAGNEPIWQALLRLNGLEEGDGPDQVRKVPVEFDPSPLTSGEIDGFFSFVTNEPNILRVRGEDVGTLNLPDLGIDLYQQIYIVTEETLNDRRDELVAAMRAESKGWQRAIADPELAIDLVLSEYGADLDLDPESQSLEMEDQTELITAGETATRGLFYMDEANIEANLEVLELLELPVTAELYTNEILDEIYADGIDLL
jgi:ABC-type nitrate/sulfonate/bicarbonate transport system substrate-binding protein